jgi:hypothetical protein
MVVNIHVTTVELVVTDAGSVAALSRTVLRMTLYAPPDVKSLQVPESPSVKVTLTVPLLTPSSLIHLTITLSYVANGSVQDTCIVVSVMLPTVGDNGGINSENIDQSLRDECLLTRVTWFSGCINMHYYYYYYACICVHYFLWQMPHSDLYLRCY